MISNSKHFKLILIVKYLFLAGLDAAKPGKYSISEIYESMVHPMVAAASDQCGSAKTMFGLSYEQTQEKNRNDILERLGIDLVTINGNEKFKLTATKVKQLMADASTVFIFIHGFTDSPEGTLAKAVTSPLLHKPDLKVFALDGRKIIGSEYFSSSTNVRIMGELLGSLLADVVESGQDPSVFHIAGHSLGSHIAGAAGKKFHELTGKLIGRITGIDPAGPCFSNVTTDERLDETDAEYVDVIHSDDGSLGLKKPVGHKDFYPNGGSSQPGCTNDICDHYRAGFFFAESISLPTNFPAQKCDGWPMFIDGVCSGNEESYMGYESDSNDPGLYFLITKDRAPFGVGSAGIEMDD
ncbi:hypothetical protein PYW07_012129 [Mythimna separata]|uniref:Lipase domain-containing protein n=1 Tax=Mythimna separata TaxID=271217 RepID=A0AAD7YL31_MYTSE|nr:hypothetical protein PYW07_012129 [Mythimna separata]